MERFTEVVPNRANGFYAEFQDGLNIIATNANDIILMPKITAFLPTKKIKVYDGNGEWALGCAKEDDPISFKVGATGSNSLTGIKKLSPTAWMSTELAKGGLYSGRIEGSLIVFSKRPDKIIKLPSHRGKAKK